MAELVSPVFQMVSLRIVVMVVVVFMVMMVLMSLGWGRDQVQISTRYQFMAPGSLL